jgi:hypothetical protein
MSTEADRQIAESHVFLTKYPEFVGTKYDVSLIRDMFEIFDLDWTAENIEKIWFMILCLEQETV